MGPVLVFEAGATRLKLAFTTTKIRCRWTRDGYVRFLCPLCREFNMAVNPETNLRPRFRCERNFNPIDFAIEVQACDFREAIA